MTDSNIGQLINKRSQNIQCCATCQRSHLGEPDAHGAFWICDHITKYLSDLYIVEGSDVCELFLSWESAEAEED